MTNGAPVASSRTLRATPASGGFAAGPIVLVEADGDADAADAGQIADSGGRLEDVGRLRAAIARADAELARAQAAAGDDADADGMIAFVREVLADETLVAAAIAAIGEGESAGPAWRHVLDAQIAEYAAADDAYFRTRTPDLRDVRDRVLRALRGVRSVRIAGDAIVVARDLAASAFLEIGWNGGGIALLDGSSQSHLAMLARSRGVPLVVGLQASLAVDPIAWRTGERALLDAREGTLTIRPDATAETRFAARRDAAERAAAGERRALDRPAVTADGVPIVVSVNIATRDDLHAVDPAHIDGVGLVRTELLLDPADLMHEARQVAAYEEILAWANGKRVVFRLIDAGADKPFAGLDVSRERNPFLGTRGIRLLLRRPDVLALQLRALVRAAARGPLDVMVPMVTIPAELSAVRVALADAVARLEADGVRAVRPRLGMMVEVPAAALALDTFDADFASLGTNDLTAYTTATARDGPGDVALSDPHAPAMRRLITLAVEAAARREIELSVCGDIAADPACVPWLLAAGVRRFSVAGPSLARLKSVLGAATAARGPHGG